MNRHLQSFPDAAAMGRLSRLASLDADELDALSSAGATRRKTAAHREIMAEGKRAAEPSMVLSGWACRSRIFRDGRRQILSLLLPGDLIGVCEQRNAMAPTAISALTEVVLCAVPRPLPHQHGLIDAYTRSGALDEFYLYRQVARLGRLNAYERIIDFILEIRDRLALVGMGTDDNFPLPLTQETFGDLLGLTSVHVNRTLQRLRRENLLDLRGGVARLKDVEHLMHVVEHRLPNIAVV
ncbi:Crp/Fnr family transcriptional regulator [Sphingomonas radiodurans]|uniref:Crp/Fnr family transcriptional regulator n=1 Tax=Sphingomonas radiodurans TaxID=2890321 RepID=UPI001E41DDD2|nr:Crp/Fnr family transcriptional regulator [Sphingomonas radiodurans]WBH18133.1 Crp/Fnr family transcriptional regulator [Sphingomonas radiodurans]